MKTYLTYGLVMAIGNALFTFALYFLGFHSDPAKLAASQGIGIVGSVVIALACIILGTKARRASIPPTEEFGYGRALGAGVMITLFAALFGIVTSLLYFGVINPDLADIMTQAELAKMEAKHMPPQAMEGAEKMLHFMMRPPIITAMGFVMAMFWGTAFSFITAAFLKRPSSSEVPPVLA